MSVSNRVGRGGRTVWAILSVFIVGSAVLSLSTLPAVSLWLWLLSLPIDTRWIRIVMLSLAAVPIYLIFACTLMLLSAASTRLMRWRTPDGAVIHIRQREWPLFDWLRYTTITYAIRVLAGTFLYATPIWRLYMRLNGARIGHGVFVNTLAVTDHNLLEIGDDTIIGSGVHLSGHTVEKGCVITARVRIGRRVTIGAQSVIGPGVEIGDDCQIGALSFVPKFARLESGGVYVGTPVKRVD